MLLSTIPMLSVNCSRKARCGAVKVAQRREFDDCFETALEKHWKDDHAARKGVEQAGADGAVSDGRSMISMRRFSIAHCPIKPSPTDTGEEDVGLHRCPRNWTARTSRPGRLNPSGT